MEPQRLLPIHGFVLAGGKSSRMGGRDKATLALHGKTFIEIALTKLRGFCAEVSISGNRDDLQFLAPIVHEARQNAGPGAGLEACLQACQQLWALFIPVDVPLVPTSLLRNWARQTIRDPMIVGSTLKSTRGKEPAFFLASTRKCESAVSRALAADKRSLDAIYNRIREVHGPSSLPVMDASAYSPNSPDEQIELWFSNINTPADLSGAEAFTQPKP